MNLTYYNYTTTEKRRKILCVPTLSVLGADQWQVSVLADLLIEPQRLPQCSLFICFILNLLGALQQLISLSGTQKQQIHY